MEGLLFYILLLLSYIAYKLMFRIFPAIKKWAGYPPKRLKGKFCQTDFLIMPSDFEQIEFEYEVNQRGMHTIAELTSLANFDSLGKRLFLNGKMKLTKSEFFQNSYFGSYGIVAQKMNKGNFFVDCALDCSPEAFNLILDRLKNQQPVLIRLYACEVAKGERYVADHFKILTLESISGPKYFIEKYLEYVTKEGELSPEKFASLKESFRHATKK